MVVSPVDVTTESSVTVVWAKDIASRNVVLRMRGYVAILIDLGAGTGQTPF